MILEDFHVHSNFSDGADTPERMAEAALAQGMTRLGFSDHGYAPYDCDCCIPPERLSAYRPAIDALRARYCGRLEIFCGVEQDIFSDAPTDAYDYVIGSVHYLCMDGEYCCIDDTAEQIRNAAARHFGGDIYALTEAYYRTVAQVFACTHCDIIGHFDLIAKLNERCHLFDPAHPRYVAAYRAAADALLESGRPFEINTGAMARGYRSVPYPAPEIQCYLASRGASFVLSSDSHSAETLRYGFAKAEAEAAANGLRLVRFSPPHSGA
ncbi:MAG: histidinol-phosphatase HisJ family protein [Oscillospiraceae bacterium]|nr:histidinol-phosphatase HisJ family protein [Oscillospiraceae bacterium]